MAHRLAFARYGEHMDAPRSRRGGRVHGHPLREVSSSRGDREADDRAAGGAQRISPAHDHRALGGAEDRKSTRLNSSHVSISYAVFCLKKKKKNERKMKTV